MGLYLFPVNPGSHLTSLGLYISLKKNDDNSRFNFPKVTGKKTFLMRLVESHYENI